MALIAFGLGLAYNPWYLYYLMAHGALGGMSIHAVTGGAFLFIVVSYKAILLLSGKGLGIKRSAILSLMTMFFIVFLGGVVTGLVRGNEFVVFGLDAFPLCEMFCLYYFIRLTPEMEINFSRVFKWLAAYMLLMCITDIASYSYLTYIKGISFGALRANIGGTVVNRLMDFIVPVLGPGLIIFTKDSKNKFIRLFLPICVLLTIGLAFYRTVYAAFFVTTAFLLIQNRKNVMLFAKPILIALIIGFIAIFSSQSAQIDYESDMGGLMLERARSIFDSANDDSSISARFEQIPLMLDEVPKDPILGKGFGGTIDSGPIKYTANYFLQVLLLLGIPGGVLFIWLYFKVISVLQWLSRTAADQKEQLFFSMSASVLAGLATILWFFPYTMYFPLHYLLGVIAGIADICCLRRKRQMLLNLKAINE